MYILGHTIPHPGRVARRMLLCELPLVLLAAVALLIRFLSVWEADPLAAALRYGEAPFYILASFALSVSTSLLCDLAERRGHR